MAFKIGGLLCTNVRICAPVWKRFSLKQKKFNYSGELNKPEGDNGNKDRYDSPNVSNIVPKCSLTKTT